MREAINNLVRKHNDHEIFHYTCRIRRACDQTAGLHSANNTSRCVISPTRGLSFKTFRFDPGKRARYLYKCTTARSGKTSKQ